MIEFTSRIPSQGRAWTSGFVASLSFGGRPLFLLVATFLFEVLLGYGLRVLAAFVFAAHDLASRLRPTNCQSQPIVSQAVATEPEALDDTDKSWRDPKDCEDSGIPVLPTSPSGQQHEPRSWVLCGCHEESPQPGEIRAIAEADDLAGVIDGSGAVQLPPVTCRQQRLERDRSCAALPNHCFRQVFDD